MAGSDVEVCAVFCKSVLIEIIAVQHCQENAQVRVVECCTEPEHDSEELRNPSPFECRPDESVANEDPHHNGDRDMKRGNQEDDIEYRLAHFMERECKESIDDY